MVSFSCGICSYVYYSSISSLPAMKFNSRQLGPLGSGCLQLITHSACQLGRGKWTCFNQDHGDGIDALHVTAKKYLQLNSCNQPSIKSSLFACIIWKSSWIVSLLWSLGQYFMIGCMQSSTRQQNAFRMMWILVFFLHWGKHIHCCWLLSTHIQYLSAILKSL